MTQNRISDHSNDRKYFVITPRLVLMLAESPHEYTLWAAIRDIAGETGECFLSTPDLATLAMQSAGSVSKYRKTLIEKGLLEGEIKKDAGYPQPVWHLSIPDLWQRNIEISMRYPTLADRILFRKDSFHLVKPSGGERGLSRGERGLSRDETKKKEKKGENKNQPLSPYLNPLTKAGKPKSEYSLTCEKLEIWFVRCRLGDGWQNVPVEALLNFLPDWEKGGSGLMKTWRNPLYAIYKKMNQDFEFTKLVIQLAIDRMQNLTFSKPVQISAVADSLILDIASGKVVLADYIEDEDEDDIEWSEHQDEVPEKLTAEMLADLQGLAARQGARNE